NPVPGRHGSRRPAPPGGAALIEADRWQRLEGVLDAALERDRSEWPALLEERCRGDPELRRQVEALLARLDEASGFLASPPVALAEALLAEAREEESTREVGRRIGAWGLLREIG